MMSSTVDGSFSTTISTLEAAADQYNKVEDDASLPEVFHRSGQGLHLVNNALQTAQTQIAGRRDLARDAIQECNAKAKIAKSIFERVAQPSAEGSRFERYKAAVKEVGQGCMVEDLVIGMMNDVCALAENDAIKTVMKDHVMELRGVIKELSNMDPSVPKERLGDSYNNWGSGDMLNAPGGRAIRNDFNGATISGPMNF